MEQIDATQRQRQEHIDTARRRKQELMQTFISQFKKLNDYIVRIEEFAKRNDPTPASEFEAIKAFGTWIMVCQFFSQKWKEYFDPTKGSGRSPDDGCRCSFIHCFLYN